MVLSGEPGIGKTALIGEVLARSAERGYQVLSGRAAEFERELPFGVLADALEAELDSPWWRDLIREEDIELLATFLPALAARSAGAPRKVQPDERHRVLRALHSLIDALAAKGPLVLALDDLHWADPASVDLVCRLLHRGITSPSLIVLASRPGQSEPRLRTALAEVGRHGHALRLELTPLSAIEAQELLGSEVDAELGETLYRESGGNPLYLEQLAAAARRGTVLPAGDLAPAELGVPAAVSAAIRGELDDLSAAARTLLQGAALLGDPFEPDLAAETSGVGEAEALSALDELLESDLIRAADSRRFRFRHPIVRHAVYETAGAGWRLAAHGRAAALLEGRSASVASRAPHIERSARVGDQAAAVVLVRAGQELTSRAPASAARWFEAALRVIPEREDNIEYRLGLLAQRAAALGLAGRIEESREALREFLKLSPPEPTELRLRAAVLTAILDELLGTHDAGRRLLLDELAKLPNQQGPDAAELKRELAFTCFMDADWQATEGWAKRALAAECQGMVRVGALAALALAEFGLGQLDEVERAVSEGAELFDRLTEDEVAAHHPGIAIWLGWAEVCIGRFNDAICHAERSIAISRAVGQRHLTVGLLAVQAQALAFTGRSSDLVAVAEAATEAALLSASDLFLSWAMTAQSQASLLTGDLPAAVRFGERAAGAAAATRSPLSDIARVQLAAALLEAGEPERCLEQLLDAAGEPDLPPFPLFEAFAYELLVRAEIALGKPERAKGCAQHADETAGRLGIALPLCQARRAVALVLFAHGDARAAVAEALASSEAAERGGAPVEAARSRIIAGRALVAAGDRAAGKAALESAHSQLISHGALRYSDEAAQELRKLGATVPRAARRRQGDSSILGLTNRELEVMELVAAGKTNREIADGLFLSVRTVDRHLARIFDRLDVKSRAAAASAFERARSQLSLPAPLSRPRDRRV